MGNMILCIYAVKMYIFGHKEEKYAGKIKKYAYLHLHFIKNMVE